MPIGTEIDYFGTGIKGTIGTRDFEISIVNGDDFDLKGWFVANGSAGTPNCMGRFVKMGSSSGVLAGTNDVVVVEHNHGITQEVHTHAYLHDADSGITIADSEGPYELQDSALPTNTEGSNADITINNEGVSGVGKNVPLCITSIKIIRMS